MIVKQDKTNVKNRDFTLRKLCVIIFYTFVSEEHFKHNVYFVE